MKLKTFQKQDLARAALHDGLILSWDCGLGKTFAMFLWPLIKLGWKRDSIGLKPCLKPLADATKRRVFAPNVHRFRPKAPVLIVAPGDLHQQIANEAWEHFGIVIRAMDSQETFDRFTAALHSRKTRLDASGRPLLEPDFYITSYTQLTTNGVQRIPDVQDHLDDITALRHQLHLENGDHVGTDAVAKYCTDQGITWPEWPRHRPHFNTTCEFFAWRQVCWRDLYSSFNTDAVKATRASIQQEYDQRVAILEQWSNQEMAGAEQVQLDEKFAMLQQLVTDHPDPRFQDLQPAQQDFVTKHFLYHWLGDASLNEGRIRKYTQWEDGTWHAAPIIDPEKAPAEAPAGQAVIVTRHIKCVYSPSLSDMCYNAFMGVVLDEAVKIKGADTYVGKGVRQMDPAYRLVLTATPIKNRVPDLFWLAHWATGGRDEAHARWPYSSDPGEQRKFAETFMVSESNLTKNSDPGQAKKPNKRYQKLTAEVCNVHRLWKLLGPIVLRRRKDDCGEDIVPKIRKVVRCKMGTLQARVYQYHLQAPYLDVNGEDALGARLQSLRQAAADPTCDLPRKHLREDTCPTEDCHCTRQPVPPAEQLRRLQAKREQLMQRDSAANTGFETDADWEQAIAGVDYEIANPIQRFDPIKPDENCVICGGRGGVQLPFRSGNSFIPKHASVLNLVQEILARKEQVVIGAAFNAPLDVLAGYLSQAGVRHLKLDGRTSQKKRGQLAAQFKRGRVNASQREATHQAVPVMLAGVDCVSEGHSFHLANNIILLAYSWAYDKFIQFINRVHRMTSSKPVNVYVVICDGTIDRRLESLIGEKGDSSELVLDGRLLGERPEEVNLVELLNIAHHEFDANSDTIDEALIHAQWPDLKQKLNQAMREWDDGLITSEPLPAMKPICRPADPVKKSSPPNQKITTSKATTSATRKLRYNPDTGKYSVMTVEPIAELPPPPPPKPAAVSQPKSTPIQTSIPIPKPIPTTTETPKESWREALRRRPTKPMLVISNNPWDNL